MVIESKRLRGTIHVTHWRERGRERDEMHTKY
jgi:hypothetical protein